MTVCLTSVILVFISGIILGDCPFNVIQLLWINMIMDTLAAFALATESPNPTSLSTKLVTQNDKIVTPGMWKNILS
jgi:magnesium-transporting ATPase (P-type)